MTRTSAGTDNDSLKGAAGDDVLSLAPAPSGLSAADRLLDLDALVADQGADPGVRGGHPDPDLDGTVGHVVAERVVEGLDDRGRLVLAITVLLLMRVPVGLPLAPPR